MAFTFYDDDMALLFCDDLSLLWLNLVLQSESRVAVVLVNQKRRALQKWHTIDRVRQRIISFASFPYEFNPQELEGRHFAMRLFSVCGWNAVPHT